LVHKNISNFFYTQFSYKSLLKFPLKFWQSSFYTGRFQVIDIYIVYTSNISHLITQSQSNRSGSQSHKYHHHHHNYNVYNIYWTTIYYYRRINEINTHWWNMIINVLIFQNTRIYFLELDNKKWTKVRIYSCRACDGLETKYILLKYEYHNKYSNTKIQQFRKTNTYSYSINFFFFVSIGILSHSTTKIVSSFIFNFNSRFHKINHATNTNFTSIIITL